GYITAPHYYNFTLGVQGALPASINNLYYLKESLPPGATWGVVHHGMKNLSLLATAISMGATLIRCGFEDSFTYAPGKIAQKNTEIVKEVRKMIEILGFEVATPDEAREILDLI
ncbi:MAG: 3-keto-5-aminohexanoate cleavage protein, partial [bacterium]